MRVILPFDPQNPGSGIRLGELPAPEPGTREEKAQVIDEIMAFAD